MHQGFVNEQVSLITSKLFLNYNFQGDVHRVKSSSRGRFRFGIVDSKQGHRFAENEKKVKHIDAKYNENFRHDNDYNTK